MAEVAWLFGILGGICLIVGNLTALAILPEFLELGWAFWMAESAILMLICLAFALGHQGQGTY